MSETMTTAWRVQKITATPEATFAELERVEWSKQVPDFKASEPEFVDAEPGEPGALAVLSGRGRLLIDVGDDLDVEPGDDVEVSVKVRVDLR